MNMDTNTNNMNIPDKLIYKRSEVIKIARLEGKVIDYWQKEFGGFTPSINQMGEIFYSRSDLDLILKIKHWMIDEKIEKAKVKEILLGTQKIEIPPEIATDNIIEKKSGQPPIKKLKIIRKGLQDILTILDKNVKN